MTIQRLFESLDTIDRTDNPFENGENKKIYDNFYSTCMDPLLEKGLLTENDANTKLAELLDYERRHAFEVGYQTAISLIFAGVTVE